MRPLNLGETLDASIRLTKDHWKTLALIVVGVLLPLHVLSAIVTLSTTDTYEASGGLGFEDGGSATYSDEGAYVGGQVVVGLLTVLGYLAATVAATQAVAVAYLGRRPSAGASLRHALRRLPKIVVLAIVFGLGVFFGFLALIVPGLWLLVAWALAFPALLVEDLGPVKSLSRSRRLVKGHWWATFARFLVGYILVSVVSGIVAGLLLVGLLVAVDDSSAAAVWISSLTNVVVNALTTPFLAAVTVLTYFDLRVRKEGFDLALAAERMGGGDATAPAPEFAPPPPAGGWAPPVAPQPSVPPPRPATDPFGRSGPEPDPFGRADG